MNSDVKECCDTYNISSVTWDSEDDGSGGSGADNSTDSPEERQAVQHLTEGLAGLVAEVESLSELGASRSIDSADVLNVCIDTWS